MIYSQIWQNFGRDEYLCKLGKEYLNASLCKFVIYFSQHSETFDLSHVFLPLIVTELSTPKQVWFFGPPCSNKFVVFTRWQWYSQQSFEMFYFFYVVVVITTWKGGCVCAYSMFALHCTLTCLCRLQQLKASTVRYKLFQQRPNQRSLSLLDLMVFS